MKKLSDSQFQEVLDIFGMIKKLNVKIEKVIFEGVRFELAFEKAKKGKK